MLKKYTNISNLVTMEEAFHKGGRLLSPSDLSIIRNGSIVFSDEEIYWTGKTEDLPKEYDHISTTSMSGKTITPEIIDSHTHLVFAGNRSNEYSMRLNGADYEEIANKGGGILSTMTSTNDASRSE